MTPKPPPRVVWVVVMSSGRPWAVRVDKASAMRDRFKDVAETVAQGAGVSPRILLRHHETKEGGCRMTDIDRFEESAIIKDPVAGWLIRSKDALHAALREFERKVIARLARATGPMTMDADDEAMLRGCGGMRPDVAFAEIDLLRAALAARDAELAEVRQARTEERTVTDAARVDEMTLLVARAERAERSLAACLTVADGYGDKVPAEELEGLAVSRVVALRARVAALEAEIGRLREAAREVVGWMATAEALDWERGGEDQVAALRTALAEPAGEVAKDDGDAGGGQ